MCEELGDKNMHESNQPDGEIEQLLPWLDEQVESSRESYHRDTNDRHTTISLGKIRAYKSVRKEIIDRLEEAND